VIRGSCWTSRARGPISSAERKRKREREDEKVASNSRKLLPNCKVENEGEIGNCRGSIRERRDNPPIDLFQEAPFCPRSLNFLGNFVVGLTKGLQLYSLDIHPPRMNIEREKTQGNFSDSHDEEQFGRHNPNVSFLENFSKI